VATMISLSKSKSHYDQQSVHQSVLVPGACLSGTRDQFFFLPEMLFRQLRVCYFVAPSLTRGWVCNLLSLLVLAGAVPLGVCPLWQRSALSFVSISLISQYVPDQLMETISLNTTRWVVPSRK
jgi:hypothetical protein